jgi:hypothetical protein
MTKTNVTFDRFELFSQEKQQRGKKDWEPIDWSSITSLAKMKSLKGKSFPGSYGKRFAIVSGAFSRQSEVPHVLVECGNFRADQKPTQWKEGLEECKVVPLAEGHVWIHPGHIAMPLSGNCITIRRTRQGPSIDDICWWLRGVLGVHMVEPRFVASGDFYDRFEEADAFKKVILRFRPKVDASLPFAKFETEESRIAKNIDAGRLILEASPKEGRLFPKKAVQDLLAPFLAELGLKRYKGNEPIELYECELTADGTEAGDDEEFRRSDILRLSRISNTYAIEAPSASEISIAHLRDIVEEELTSWLG